MNQIRYGQLTKYGEQRGNIGNKLGDMEFSYFPQQWDAGRRGARAGEDRTGAAAGARASRRDRQIARDQYLGGSQRIRTGDQGPDNV
jgi:hypothetical protein